ncbi:MAG: replication initiation factor domain-containing protein, partial [Rudaea sp.]
HDDFGGSHPLSWAREQFDTGEFARGGRPPKGEFIDDCGSNDGCTFYVGKNTGNQTLCVYEKGKQLGDKASPWVRYEGRFGNKYRAIPTDVLRRPGEFLAGMFPVLSWISGVAEKFATAVAKTKAGMQSLAFHLKRQYGKLLHFAQTIHQTPDEIARWVESVSRSGLPDKLKVPHVATVMSAASLRSQLCASW